MSKHAERPVYGVVDIDDPLLPIERSFWGVPVQFGAPASSDMPGYELRIAGDRQINIPDASKRFIVSSAIVRVVNALMYINEADDRLMSFSSFDICRYGTGGAGDTAESRIFSSTQMNRVVDDLECIGNEYLGRPIIERVTPRPGFNDDGTVKLRGSGIRNEYRFDPSIYLSDVRAE